MWHYGQIDIKVYSNNEMLIDGDEISSRMALRQPFR
jgi:hypothetical protein